MTPEVSAGNALAWSLVVSLSVSMLAGAAWLAVVLYVTASNLLKEHNKNDPRR